MWLRPLMLAGTYIGEPILVISSAMIAIVLAVHSDSPQIAWAFVAALAAFGFSTILKLFLHRTRPDTLYVTTMRFKSYSFPSGHAFGTTVVYGLLIFLAYSQIDSYWNVILLGLGWLGLLIIGLSRVYLGAHYPTDVLGGWLLSSIFLAFIIIGLANA